MADNVLVNPATRASAINVATEDRGGVHYPLYQNANLISSTANNSRDAATLAAAATFQGVGEDVSNFGRAGISITSDNATDGVLTIEVSHDNVNWGGPTRTWSDTSIGQPHMWNIVEQYFRIKYVNGTTEATNLSIQVQYSNNADVLLGHQLNETLLDETEAIVSRSVIVGKTDGGVYKNVPVGHNGALYIEQPKTVFGELLTAEKTPQVQVKFPYGINDLQVQTLLNNTSAGSAVSVSQSVCSITAADTYPSFAQIRTLDTVRYGAGQGSEILFTAAFTAGVALSEQHIGAGDDDEGFFFGYEGADFSIEHHYHGELEIRTLEITQGGDAGGGTCTITLDGTAVTVTIPAGSATIAEVCAIIVAAQQDFQNAGRGWEVHTDDNVSVEFISLVAEPAAGTFSFADVDSGVTGGTFNQATTTILGVAPSEGSVAQANWNVDVMDGSGSASNPSGVLLADGATPGPLALAIDNLIPYRISWQYLGAGAITYEIEKPSGGWQVVHVIQRSGTAATSSIRNPTLNLTAIAKTESGYSGGALTIKTASLGGFIQGKESELGIRHSAKGQKSITTTTQANVLTIHSSLEYNGTRNKINSYPDQLTVANEVTKTIVVLITVNPTEVSGTVSLAAVDSGRTPMEFDTAGTLVVGGTVLQEYTVGGGAAETFDLSSLREYLRPGDRWVISAAKTTGGTSGDVAVGISWKDRL